MSDLEKSLYKKSFDRYERFSPYSSLCDFEGGVVDVHNNIYFFRPSHNEYFRHSDKKVISVKKEKNGDGTQGSISCHISDSQVDKEFENERNLFESEKFPSLSPPLTINAENKSIIKVQMKPIAKMKKSKRKKVRNEGKERIGKVNEFIGILSKSTRKARRDQEIKDRIDARIRQREIQKKTLQLFRKYQLSQLKPSETFLGNFRSMHKKNWKKKLVSRSKSTTRLVKKRKKKIKRNYESRRIKSSHGGLSRPSSSSKGRRRGRPRSSDGNGNILRQRRRLRRIRSGFGLSKSTSGKISDGNVDVDKVDFRSGVSRYGISSVRDAYFVKRKKEENSLNRKYDAMTYTFK